MLNMKKKLLYLFALFICSQSLMAQMDTILIDFGNNISPAPWNNVTGPASGSIADLMNSAGIMTGRSISVVDPFNNINTGGTQSPDPAIGFPATATGDSFFGNTSDFGGQVQPTGGVRLGSLVPGKAYTITIFASRAASDNREAQYVLEGMTNDTLYLNASDNTDMVVTATLMPAADSSIVITASPGPNNNNGAGFYYLGAMKVVYEHEEPPAGPMDTIMIDFGNNISPAPWNNVTGPASGNIADLMNSAGIMTGRSIAVVDPFNNINTGGTQSPDPAIGFPATATGDSFFGNTSDFGGQVQPTGGVRLGSLVPGKAYTITIFASRDASDNREAQYVLEGMTNDTLYLNASGNTDMVVTATLMPDADSSILITASPGPNNDNGAGFYYLGAMKVTYEHEEPPVVQTMDTLLIDFGNNLSPAPWNNITAPADGQIDDLIKSTGDPSGRGILVFDPFNNINTGGTQSPDPAIGFPSTATGDSFFGNTSVFGGQVQPTGGVELFNLDTAKPYTISIFASRDATDNREAQYLVEGMTNDTLYLNASGNTDMVVTATLMPAANGTIRITASPGPNNDNGSGFYYLGAMKVVYEHEEPPVEPMDTLLIDFGNNPTPAPWNNIGDPVAGQIDNLITSAGFSSGKKISIIDDFNHINTNGTQSPDPSLGIPATASGDSFYGNTEIWSGQTQPTAGVELSNLNPDKSYTLSMFASRDATDNRETQYIVEGATTDTLYLQVAGNTNELATTTMMPDANGTIRVLMSAGPNNNNAYHFYYLGAMKVIYEHEEPTTPAGLALVSPNGGEIWQVGKTPSISWESENLIDVTIEYSTDNGAAWTTIATVPAFQKEYVWTVPNMPSQECLVRLTSDTLTDVSDAVFEITSDTVTCRIVVLGSSTAAGAGASSPDSSWVGRFRNTIFQRNTRYEVVNLAQGGYTTYHILPTGTTIPGGTGPIDQGRNVTRALSFDPYAIIVNMPSNDAANNYPVADQLANFDLIATTANDQGVEVWIATTQPRNFSNSSQIQIQTDVRDSILAIYGEYAIDFWNGMAAPDGFILDEYDSGDGVHVNDAGHKLLFERVLEKGIDTIDCTAITGTEDQLPLGAAQVKIFPNPFDEMMTVEFETVSAGEFEITLTDLLGRRTGTWQQAVPAGGIHRLQIRPALSEGRQLLFGQITIRDTRGLVHGSVKLVKE